MTQITNETPRTTWFPANINPVRAGLYETERFCVGEDASGVHLAQWNGATWSYASDCGWMYAGDCMVMDAHDGDQWRGLTEETK